MPALQQLNTTTVADIVKDALLDLGAIGENEKLSANTIEHGRRVLNRMLDTWNAERLSIYTVNPQSFPLVPGQQIYMVGQGGDFDVARPVDIDYAYLSVTNIAPAGPLDIPIGIVSDEEWAAIPAKTLSNLYIDRIWYSPDFPQGTLRVYPVPTQANNLVLGLRNQLSSFASSTDPFQLPPAYAEAIVSHLEIRLAPSYGKSVSAETAQIAIKAKATLKRANAPDTKMACDTAIASKGGAWNWLTGGYKR